MINLIPPGAKKEIVREYWLRMVSVWKLLFGLSLILVAIMFAPAYLIVQLQLDAYAENYASAFVNADNFDAGELKLEEANLFSRTLLKTTEGDSLVEIIRTLENLSGSQIVVEGMKLERDEESVKEVLLTGQAKDRSSLNEFRNKIEADAQFANVFLPISNLAKEEDISFDITVTLASAVTEEESEL